MASIEIKVNVGGIGRIRQTLTRLGNSMRNRRALHERWAILALNWINKNFESEGALVGGWKRLSPNTLAGRRGGSGRILQDTGELRRSFQPSWTSEHASVGSPLKIASYHEYGTKPYVIRPKKPGGVLRFAVATESGVRTRTFKSGRQIQVPFAKGGFVYRKEVHHPGLTARRMLPRQSDPALIRDLRNAAEDYLRDNEGG